MRISFRKEFRDSAQNLLRRCGYSEHYDPYVKKTSFIRRFSRLPYPRFHLYVNEESKNQLVFNLHLDAKKPSYPGSHAHSAEYDNEVVKQETLRIKSILESY